MNFMKQLLSDEAGFVVSTELVLISTIVIIGMITGLTTLRDGVVQELSDVSAAIGSVENSYTFNSVNAHTSATNGSAFTDQADYCEANTGTDTAAGTAPLCLNLATNALTTGEAAILVVPNGTAGN